MRLTNLMSESAKNRQVAEKFESQRVDENPESIESPESDKLTSTGTDTEPSASSVSSTSRTNKKKGTKVLKNFGS